MIYDSSMGSKRNRKRVGDAYNSNLRSWATREQARLGGIAHRPWADKVTEKTGISVTYTVIGKWLKGDYKEEMEERALLALSRWRGDASPEHTRTWLWGDTALYDNEEINRVLAWIKTARPEDVSVVVKEGMSRLVADKGKVEQLIKLPDMAIRMQQAGIPLEILLEDSSLNEDEKAIAFLYLAGETVEDLDPIIYDDLLFTLKRLIKSGKNAGESHESLRQWIENSLRR